MQRSHCGRAAPFLIVALLWGMIACSPREVSRTFGAFSITIDANGERFEVRDAERVLLRSAAFPAERLRFDGEAKMLFGRFRFSQDINAETPVEGIRWDGDVLVLGAGALRLTPRVHGQRLELGVTQHGAADGWRLRYDCSVHQNFLGFGEQYSFVAMKGHRVPIWVEENGLGRGQNGTPPMGTLYSSYYPMPYFLDPRGMGFVADSSAYQEFSLCEEETPNTWHVEIWDQRPFAIHVLRGPAPIDVVAQLTEVTGRPGLLPDWGFELWLAAQGGSDAVRGLLNAADDAGIPYSAVWVQDWVGQREFAPGLFGVKYRWAEDPDFYVDLKGLVAEIHDRGKRFLGYFNPFIPPDYEQYAEGKDAGYLIRNAAGEPYLFTVSVFDASLVDLTNPDAVVWFQNYAREALDIGFDGWMADFGEWLPWDAVLHAGEARYVHNIYPMLWHRANRDVLEEKRPDGDFILLTRSGHLHEGGVAQVVWAGDQEANWDKHDGFPTAVKAMLSMGLSGIPYVTHDIAGFSGGPSSEELWLRWVELGAFSPIMRLHDGLKKYENWHFRSSADSAAFLARFAHIHLQLKPYLKALASEAVEKGYPLVRHSILVESEPGAELVDDQFFLGNDLLVAPVLTKGSVEREVRFPPGAWRAVFAQSVIEGPGLKVIAAPIGSPAIFVRVGSGVDELLASVPEE
jgi:sulfoquinovosidase